MYRYLNFVLFTICLPVFSQETSVESADIRLRRCYQFAREANNKQVLEQILKLREIVKRNLDTNQPQLAEGALIEAEKLVGIDPGGKSMFGKPISYLNQTQRTQIDQLEKELQKSMNQNKSEDIEKIVREYKKVLGDSLGLPDFRARPEPTKAKLLKEKDATELFLKILSTETKISKTLLSGIPPEGSMARGFASAVMALCEIRPFVLKHFPNRSDEVDQLIHGGCKCLLSIQDKEGFFYFPDLRGKHIRFEEMIEKILLADEKSVKGGWVIKVFDDGGSLFDTGEAGIALLRAGETLSNPDWIKAGLLAANWTLSQSVVPNWNYNAFAVSLLSQAYRISKDKKYLEGALSKFKMGMLPGQLESGVWLDPHNARIVYHGILLRACNDLRSILPEKHEDYEIVLKANQQAAKYFLETQKDGPFTISHGLAELQRCPKLEGLRTIEEQLASAIIGRCIPKGGLRAGASLTEIAALAKVIPE